MRQVPLLLPENQTTPVTLQRSRDQTRVEPGEVGNRIRLPGLPVLLAGPILRRAALDEIVIWVATSVPVTVVGRVLDQRIDSNGRPSGSPLELGQGRARAVQLATNLFVTHVAITPASRAFLTGKILSYDLTFVAPAGHQFAGRAAGLVPKEQLTYGDLTLPSFILDPTDRRGTDPVRRTVFLHGSCRKLGGPGPDMASKLDDQINRSHKNAQERPRFLLLTGDQVYGDDVPADLFRPLVRTSRLLLGFRDVLPDTSITLDSRPNRGELVRRDGGLTSGYADHHLLGFGEYAAIYLFAWSPAIWDCAPIREISADARRRNYQDAIYMRRAMANIPCYLMIDDHEVTDDWPMDNGMVRNVTTSPYGEWIIANGTAAAYFFQLQGNLPRSSRGRYASVARRLQDYCGKAMLWEAAREAYLASPNDETLHQNMDAAYMPYLEARRQYVRDARQIRGLHAVAPTVPEVLILDTRTHRALTDDGPPGLLNAAARSWIRRQLPDLPGPGYEPLLVVSPPPVVGNPNFEEGQGVVAGVARYGGRIPTRFSGDIGALRYSIDCEAWSLNMDNLIAMFRTLRPLLRKVIFVSGDVHFAYTAVGRWAASTWDSTPLEFVQMTGSAMRNATEGGLGFGMQIAAPISWSREGHGTLSYQFVGEGVRDATFNQTLVTENNLSHATVDWVGVNDVRVTHKIITPRRERVDRVDF